MKRDIQHHIKECCNSCLRKNKNTSTHIAPIQEFNVIGIPFHKVAIDIIGPMTMTKTNKNRFALVIIDLATKWVEVIPLKDITSERICTALLSVFTKYGFPRDILSDNGTQFVSNLTKAFHELLEITQIFSTRYHPQSNGCVERFNQTIKLMIQKCCIDKPKEWDVYLPMLLFAYRNAIHQTTNYSPFELMFGRKANSPLDNFKNTILDNDDIEYNTEEYIEDLKSQLGYVNKIANENLKMSGQKQREIKNKHRYLRTLKPNDLVLVFSPTPTNSNKEWHGPYTVKKRINTVSYEISVKDSIRKFHINDLRKYSVTAENINKIEHNVTSENSSEDYVVIKLNDDTNVSQVQNCNVLQNSNTKQSYKDISLAHLKELQIKEVKEILKKFEKVISDKPGHTETIEHCIELNDETHFRAKVYQVPQMQKANVEKELDTLLKEGLIRKSISQISSPMVIVKKKDNSIRLCCDYRKLNAVTKIDQEGLANIEDIVNEIGKGKIFSTLDLTRGFWQIPMQEQSKQYTAFTTDQGLYEWNVMPFGLINSTATFTKMMRKIIPRHPNIVHYVDDICIFTETWEQHLKVLEELLAILAEHNLTISPQKMKLAQNEIEFLGHKFKDQAIQPIDRMQEKMLNIKKPETKKQVRALLGLFGYYRDFIENYSQIVKPLVNLTRKGQSNTKINWTSECEKAMQNLKILFSKEPILTTISAKDTIILATDASRQGLGACLMKHCLEENSNMTNKKEKKIMGIYKPALYISRSLTKAEEKYSVIELEGLAIVWAVTKLRRYLLGRKFTIFTDHKPLINFNVSNVNNNRINKFAMKLSDYQFNIQSIKGTDNHIPDILSRLAM